MTDGKDIALRSNAASAVSAASAASAENILIEATVKRALRLDIDPERERENRQSLASSNINQRAGVKRLRAMLRERLRRSEQLQRIQALASGSIGSDGLACGWIGRDQLEPLQQEIIPWLRHQPGLHGLMLRQIELVVVDELRAELKRRCIDVASKEAPPATDSSRLVDELHAARDALSQEARAYAREVIAELGARIGEPEIEKVLHEISESERYKGLPEAERVAAMEHVREAVLIAIEEQKRETLAAVARKLILPKPVSAMNAEVVAMATGVMLDALKDNDFPQPRDDDPDEIQRWAKAVHELFSEATRAGKDPIKWATEFTVTWRKSGFPRLEVSHKLAASLCLTDVPSGDVHAPWDAWSLILPNGLLGDKLARVWCLGADPRFIVETNGRVLAWNEANVGGRVHVEMVLSLVRGACLAMADPSRVQQKGRWGSRSLEHTKHRNGTEEPADGVSYLLSHPVSVDLREVVREAASGRSRNGAPLKVQFTVRGHWRNQACGQRRTERKHLWIQPYWKGPKDSRVLLRSHVLNDET